jgi:hypothetical protein
VIYADFNYDSFIIAGQAGNTTSAVFLGEAFWSGGLPMTTVTSLQPCISLPNTSIQEGWSYCLFQFGNGASNPWDMHEQIIAYFTNAQAPTYPVPTNAAAVQVYPNDILINAGEGSQILLTGTNQTQYFDNARTAFVTSINNGGSNTTPPDESNTDLHDYIPDLRQGLVVDRAGLSSYVINAFGSNPPQMGDYMFINPVPGGSRSDTHGLIIIGWQDPMDCSNAWAARATITNFAPTYSTGLVPWVADATTSQQPTPRPFYCTMASANGGSLRFSRHDWYFYRMPDQLTINPSQLYVDPMWSW